jgi:hypothetical protein
MADDMNSTFYWVPKGTWNIAPNSPVTVPSDNLKGQSSSDENVAQELSDLVLRDATGSFFLPYDGLFQINLQANLQNDFGYPAGANGSASFQFEPVVSQEITYTIAEGALDANATLTLNNYVQGKEGDKINLIWNLEQGLDNVQASDAPNTWITLTNQTNNTNPTYYYGITGQPLAIGSASQNSIMTRAPIIDGKATFYCTQSGDPNGICKFNQGISYVDVAIQAESNDTTLIPPSDWYILPYPSDLKTVTVVFTQQGTPGAQFTVHARIEGQ